MTAHTVSEARIDTAQTDIAIDRAELTVHRLRRLFSFRNISAIYIFIGILIAFSLLIPQTFLTPSTWRTLLDNQVITGLAALALLIPLAAGIFNLAIGIQVGAGSILSAYLLVNTGMSAPLALALTLASGAVIGLVSAFLIVQVRIDSFIATLGVSSILAAAITAISNGQQILGVSDSFTHFGVGNVNGITYSFVLLMLVATVVWYFLERTPSGRRVYAVGGNIDAARLSGVNTTAVIYGSLAACGVIAALAGALLTSRLANADPTLGPAFLVPAFTAAFLGSTQFKGGRFNVWGTIVSVYVLAAGVKGLQLWGAPVWIPDAFNGVSLLLAVGLAKYQSGDAYRLIRRSLRLDRRATETANSSP